MSKETILKNLQHNIAMENFKDIRFRFKRFWNGSL